MGKRIATIAACAVLTFGAFGGLVSAAGAGPGNGATQANGCPTTAAQCSFVFFDGNGALTLYVPSAYHDVITPSGNETETFRGSNIPNDTGHAVVYRTDSGAPVPPGQTCLSFQTGHTTTDWQLTITPNGGFSLECHFA